MRSARSGRGVRGVDLGALGVDLGVLCDVMCVRSGRGGDERGGASDAQTELYTIVLVGGCPQGSSRHTAPGGRYVNSSPRRGACRRRPLDSCLAPPFTNPAQDLYGIPCRGARSCSGRTELLRRCAWWSGQPFPFRNPTRSADTTAHLKLKGYGPLVGALVSVSISVSAWLAERPSSVRSLRTHRHE